MGRSQALLATLTAAKTATRPRTAMAPTEAILAACAAAEIATRACAGAKANTAVRVRHAAAGNSAVPAFPRAGMRVVEAERTAGHPATGVLARVCDRLPGRRDLRASRDGRADATAGNASPDDGYPDATLPVKLMTAARSAATPGDDAG